MARGRWDEGLRFWQMVEFEQSVQLPLSGRVQRRRGYEGAKRANDAIKEQLHEGRGVAIAFYADQSKPNQITEMGYMNPATMRTARGRTTPTMLWESAMP